MGLSTFQTGALLWIAANTPRSVQLELSNLDIVPQQEFERRFCELTGLSNDDIIRLAQSTAHLLRPKHFADSPQTIGHLHVVTFRTVRSGWNQISATVPSGPHDENLRYSQGITATGNACALDVAMILGVQLNVGRIHRDVITLVEHAKLSIPVRLFLQAISSPWGLATQAQRDAAASIIAQALSSLDARFPLGHWHGVQAVIDALFHKVPQVSWTEIKAYICCDGQLHIDPKANARTCSSVYPSLSLGQNIGQGINQHFQQQIRDHNLPVCGLDCRRSGIEQPHVILDGSNPARLIVHFRTDSCITYEKDMNQKLQVFSDFELTTLSLQGKLKTAYRVVAAVFVEHNNHFVLRWLDALEPEAAKSIRHYDSGRFTTVPKWWWHYRRKESHARRGKGVRYISEPFRLPRVLTLVYESYLL